MDKSTLALLGVGWLAVGLLIPVFHGGPDCITPPTFWSSAWWGVSWWLPGGLVVGIGLGGMISPGEDE